MTRQVWKYTLEVSSSYGREHMMPASAKIISAGIQGNNIVVWAEVDPSAALKKHIIAVVGTGWDYPDHISRWRFVGTVQFEGAAMFPYLVFHVFDGGDL